MSSKLIRLEQLQRFKTNSDATYQAKLTAGANVTISNNVISAQTTVGGQTIYNATITAAGWSGTSNTVSIQGIEVGEDVEIVGINPIGLTDQQINAAKNALYLITYGTTSANAITFYALNGLPSVDIPVTIRKILDNNITVREYSAGSGIAISGTTIAVSNPVFYATALAANWVNNENAVTVQGITASDNIEIVGFNPTGLTPSEATDVWDALALITYGATSTDTITFYAFSGTVPEVDMPLILRKLV